MALAPEPYLSACLEVLEQATIYARLAGYRGHSGGLPAEESDCLAELMDAVHNLPYLLQHWERCDERMLRSCLEAYDEKWKGHLGVRLLPRYLQVIERGSNPIATELHRDLLRGLEAPLGLILVASPTGQGKTTAIEAALRDPACPPNVVFMGDMRDDVDAARYAVFAARSRVVVMVLRTQRASSSFARLIDMRVSASEVAAVSLLAFSTRLVRSLDGDPRLLHERLVVTNEIRSLIVEGADQDAIHRRAIAEGMCSLRQAGLAQVRAGHLTQEAVATVTPAD